MEDTRTPAERRTALATGVIVAAIAMFLWYAVENGYLTL